MTDEELILKWNAMKNRLYENEEVTVEEIKEFGETVQRSYEAGQITERQMFKYAEIVCYLGKGDE